MREAIAHEQDDNSEDRAWLQTAQAVIYYTATNRGGVYSLEDVNRCAPCMDLLCLSRKAGSRKRVHLW